MSTNKKRKTQEAIERFETQRKAGIGHNTAKRHIDPVFQDHLSDFLKMDDEIAVIREHQKKIKNEAKERGYPVKAFTEVVRLLKMQPETRNKLELDRMQAKAAAGQLTLQFELAAMRELEKEREEEKSEENAEGNPKATTKESDGVEREEKSEAQPPKPSSPKKVVKNEAA